MNHKITRRTALASVGAVAATGTTACSDSAKYPRGAAVQPMHRVNLICHGMMLFFYDVKDPNFITILLPEPTMGGQEVHKIYFGEFLGGIPTRLAPTSEPDDPYKYNLLLSSASGFTRENSQFGRTQADPASRGPNSNEDMVFDTRTLTGQPQPPLKIEGKHRYSIRVPYPTDVRRFRTMDFGNYPPFADPGTGAVHDFKSKPTKMGGVHVFTYDGVTDKVVLQHDVFLGKEQTVGPDGAPQVVLNIHLYSQPDKPIQTPHLDRFNEMVTYGGGKPIDLALANGRPMPNYGSAIDLSSLDLASLSDFSTNDAFLKDPKNRTEDPVECLQGWGT